MSPRRLKPPLSARPLCWALLAFLAVSLSLACGTASSGSGTTTRARPGASPSTRPFVLSNSGEGSPHTCSAAQLAGREPPIVYRPSSLSRTQKVPLLIALHGSGGDPQKMQGLSHFEQVAAEHGFVVAFLASCDLTHPWGAPQDLPYVSSMIDQLIPAQNIDASRVYVTGFSAGGYETWLAGCKLSRKVAAIAIVSGAMNGPLYTSCSVSKPVSELLIVGTADSTRYTGIPGRLPSPFQTTARWRGLDGCSVAPVNTAQPLTVVTQQVWTSCTDGSAVGLYLIQGAAHVWPPAGVGAPPNYPTSEEVWAFLSAHRAASLSVAPGAAKLISVRAGPAVRGRVVLSATLRISEPLTVQSTLGHHQPRALTRPVPLGGLGPRIVVLTLSFSGVASGTYKLRLRLHDLYGRKGLIVRRLRV